MITKYLTLALAVGLATPALADSPVYLPTPTILLAPHHVATPTDPYAEDAYQAERADALQETRFAYWAMGCRVVGISIVPLINADHPNLGLRALQAGHGSPIVPGFAEAKQEGEAQAREPGGCGYFHEHPEVVSQLRDLELSAARAWSGH